MLQLSSRKHREKITWKAYAKVKSRKIENIKIKEIGRHQAFVKILITFWQKTRCDSIERPL